VLDRDPARSTERGTATFRGRAGSFRPPLFGPCLLWPSDWMDQDTTWYGGRPPPRRHFIRWGPSSPTESDTAALHFSADFALVRSPISATAELFVLTTVRESSF